MGEILLAQHYDEEAFRYVESLPAGKPEILWEFHGLRGKILAAQHRPKEAIAELQQAVDSDFRGDLTYVLGRQYQLVGDKPLAEAAFVRSRVLRQQSNERANNIFNDAGKK